MEKKEYDVIIIGGSYSGLAAGLTLGRAIKNVLIIDSGKACNKQTPHSHNFLTQDGNTPTEIAKIGKRQVQEYNTVEFFSGLAIKGTKSENGFEIQVSTGEIFRGGKLIFSTGIKDNLPQIDGFAECWGISVLHCPYCHGYEVKNEKTGILGNGDYGYDLVRLISNWTTDLSLFTNGPSTLTLEQTSKLEKHGVEIVTKEVEKLEHQFGCIQNIVFKNGIKSEVKALYAKNSFTQHCSIPESLGCELTDDGFIKVDSFQETSVNGVFACGDNVTRFRTVANAVAMGTNAGIAASKKIIFEQF